MKKRLLSALLALALVFVLLPTTALAGEVSYGNDYDIAINGIKWKFEKNDSGEYIPVYYYANNKFSTDADDKIYKFYTNDNLMLTKKGDTVTISFRRGTSYQSDYYHQVKFTIESKVEGSDISCIEMGNGNNLVITGEGTKGTLTLTRDGKDGIGAALSSKVGDITITGGATVNVTFKKQSTPNVSGHAISVDNHDLIISGEGTTVEATNQSGASQDFSNDATVKVENGRIDVSGGAWLKATNEFSNTSKPYPSDFNNYSYFSCAISGDKDAPCTVSVTGENSCIIASAHNSTKYVNTSMGQAYRWANFKVDGAKIEVGTSSPAQTITDINDISNYKYAKISIPALQRTSDVLIAGKDAVVGVETSIPSANGSGTYYYDQASKTLTLNNVTITSGTNAIQFAAAGTYTVKLEGTNKISNVSNGISVTDDKYITSLNVTITGTGSLDISAKGLAINMKKGDLKFENTGEIKLTTSNISPTHNVLSVSGNITITDMDKYSVTGITQTGGKPLGSEVSLTEASQLKGGTTGYRIITITPAAAKDSTISYNRKTLKQGGIITGENGGTATVDSKNNTITLDNFKGNYPLEFNAEFTPNSITLIGDSTLSAVETKYQNLTISGSGSLTAGSIKVTNNDNIRANLTINGATVTVGTAELTTRAIDIKGDLTVTNGSLKATSKSNNVPTVQVGGNASFTGSTVTITNNSTTQGERYKDSNAASSALHVNGAVTISGGTVTAEAKAGGNAIRAVGNITVSNDAIVTAKNNSQYFNAITAGSATGGEVNTLYNLIVSGENTRITATNAHDNKLAYGGAINAYIKNANEGYYLQVGTDTKAIAPNANTTVRNNSLTITRGDKVTRTNSPVVIAGTTLLNDTYYTINGSTVAEGTEDNYNAFYDSATKTLKLNNAKISTTTNAAIKIIKDLTIEVTGANELKGNHNHCIESDNNFTINGTDGTLVMTNGSNTDASVIYCGPGKRLTIAAEVIIKNEAQPGKLIHTVEKDAYSFAKGYNVYASTNVSGSPLEVYNPENYSAYKYLRVTKETLETGGGSTHEHVFSTTSWESNADYHWHKCTVQGCTEVSDKEEHVYTNTWWKNSNGNHGRTCDKCRHEGEIHEFRKYYDFADETYHVERCGYLNCTYVGRQETHSYDSFGVCKCGYSPNGLPAPPSLQGVAPTSENGTDGKILNSNIGMEYAQNLNGPWTKWNEHSNITGLSAGTYYVRYTKTDERFPDNQVATVEVPAYTPGGNPTPDVPAAPTGLAGVAPTSANSKDGKITGTTAAMEYATSLEGDWTACANGSTDVPAGKYYVRMKKTDNTPAGEAVEVTVPAYSGTGEIVPPTPDNPGTIVIIRPAEEEKPAQQPNPSTGANDLVGLAVAAAVAAALGSAALLRKHD